MKIDIIIPAYNAQKTINRTLCSIAMQDNIDDLNIYIVNDGSKKNYDEQIKIFSKLMNIKELTLNNNCGPGYARQYGIDNSDGKYIVFIDSDDLLFNSNSILNLVNKIEEDHSDVAISFFREEINNGYVVHENDTIFMHGKIYRREYLLNHNINFNNSYANEDNGFNNLLLLHDPKISYLDEETYIWKNNSDSITRVNNHEYNYTGLKGYIYNIEWALNIAIEHDFDKNKIAELSYCCLVAIYFYYLQFSDNELIKNIKNIYNITEKYSLTDEKKQEVFEVQYNFMINDNNKYFFIKPSVTFDDYLDLIINIKED